MVSNTENKNIPGVNTQVALKSDQKYIKKTLGQSIEELMNSGLDRSAAVTEAFNRADRDKQKAFNLKQGRSDKIRKINFKKMVSEGQSLKVSKIVAEKKAGVYGKGRKRMGKKI